MEGETRPRNQHVTAEREEHDELQEGSADMGLVVSLFLVHFKLILETQISVHPQRDFNKTNFVNKYFK